MDVILLPGLWLRSTAWGAVADELRRLGHRPSAVALPGADDGDASATLDDQIAAVLAAVDAADRPFVVGHSAASTLAWIAADRRPEAIAGVAMIGGFPTADGGAYADFFDVVDGVMPFPGWEPFEGPDSADLDATARERFAADAVAVPAGVSKAVVHLGDARRRRVPITLVCPEFGPDDATAWIAGGDLPELAAAERVTFVDIDSGHWPMLTRPAELAALLADAATTAVRP
jgi:pimeloyl-ACP methyl ester carboxylesterase